MEKISKIPLDFCYISVIIWNMKKIILEQMSKPLIAELFRVMKKQQLSISGTARLIGCSRFTLCRWRDGLNFPKSPKKGMMLLTMIERLRANKKPAEKFEWGKNKRKTPTGAKLEALKREGHNRTMRSLGIK